MRLLLGLVLVLASGAQTVEVSATRFGNRPLLSPRPGWMSGGVFNAAAIEVNSKTILLFRAQDEHRTSRIGYAESTDGLHFTVRPDPVLAPEADYEKGGGLEDPRVVKIDGIYYLTYTGYNLHDAQLCLATSKDLLHWDRKGVILPAYEGTWNEQWTKSGAIVPEKINGSWWMYYLGTRKGSDGKPRDEMGLAKSDDLLHWQDATNVPVLPRKPDAFDSRVMEPGPSPFLIPQGILLIYNGANDQLVYGPGWLLFDRDKPDRLLSRSDRPFALPVLTWEKTGNVPNVIFVEGVVGTPEKATAYYGAADKFLGAMRLHIAVH